MYHPIVPGTPLYRVTRISEAWPNPLLGLGAYFTQGGRYNRPQQQTVYTADDPLVAITEAAFYQALDWHRRIALQRFLPVGYPLESERWLWCSRSLALNWGDVIAGTGTSLPARRRFALQAPSVSAQRKAPAGVDP